MRNNTRTNYLIMWLVIASDIVLLNALLYLFVMVLPKLAGWNWGNLRLFFLVFNVALLAGEWKFHTRIHKRYVPAGDILRRLLLLVSTQAVIAYMLFRHVLFSTGSGWLVTYICLALFVVLLVSRFIERNLVKWFRKMGRNIRSVTVVGSDSELRTLYERLLKNPTMGYRFNGYYANEEVDNAQIPWLGSIDGLMDDIAQGREVDFGDELYVCLSRRKGDVIRQLSAVCDRQFTQFYFVPVSVETIGLNLKREFIEDIEVFAAHESPLQNPINKAVKRAFDLLLVLIYLIPTLVVFPFVVIMMKIQSPGPIFFKQKRTGLDGKEFDLYKFRSMHVNKDADKVQATKDDPRKYPFGNFMRKTNLDEVPQIFNILKGDMSVVGPRPHMLAHTEQYSQLIDKYMVRHLVKPGVTGWAQVTGYRGETKELEQMEGRVKRDIWYIEHWSFWLDIRIIWLTMKTFFKHDQNAY